MIVPSLTRREAEVLCILCLTQESGETLVYERGEAYVGFVRISARLVFSLIRKMCISESHSAGVENYIANETGKRALMQYWGINWEDIQ